MNDYRQMLDNSVRFADTITRTATRRERERILKIISETKTGNNAIAQDYLDRLARQIQGENE